MVLLSFRSEQPLDNSQQSSQAAVHKRDLRYQLNRHIRIGFITEDSTLGKLRQMAFKVYNIKRLKKFLKHTSLIFLIVQAAISQINSSPHLLPPNTEFKVKMLETNGSSFHLLKSVCTMLEGSDTEGGLHIVYGPSNKKLRQLAIST